MIFRFLKLYFAALSHIYAPCKDIADQLPLTSYMARKCFTKNAKQILNVFLFADDVALYGNMMTALKVILQDKKQSYAHTHPLLVKDIIESKNAKEFYSKQLKLQVIAKYFIHF